MFTFAHIEFEHPVGRDFAKFCGLLRIYELYKKIEHIGQLPQTIKENSFYIVSSWNLEQKWHFAFLWESLWYAMSQCVCSYTFVWLKVKVVTEISENKST